MINRGLFTSKTPEWSTPQSFFDELNKEFNFKLDVCATKKNAKCIEYYTKEEDGLSKNWLLHSGYKWMNPPYGREIKDWVKKANDTGKVVCLLPARTDTRWFHDFIYNQEGVEIRFIKGRLKFGGAKNSAPFPSMIVVFNKANK